MRALCLWQTKDCAARVALAVYVSFSVAELVSAELEKSAEAFVLASASRDVSREHSKEHPRDHRGRDDIIGYGKPHRVNEKGDDICRYHPAKADDEHHLRQRIRAVSSVHKTV
jgi:hypothetical protein